MYALKGELAPGRGLPPGVEDALMKVLRTGALDLPVLPEAASAILTETARENWSVNHVVSRLKRDPAMAAHLLRLANSPSFSGGMSVVSLQQAVTRLGASQLRAVAIIIACESRIFQVPGFETKMREIFRHSYVAALFAQEIARVRRTNVEEAFLGGILHDVGWPIAVQVVIDLHHQQRQAIDASAVLNAAERVHVEVAQALATKWKMPDRVTAALGEHHAGGSELGWVLALADTLALRAASTSANDDDLTHHPAAQALNLYPDVIDALDAKGGALWEQAQAL